MLDVFGLDGKLVRFIIGQHQEDNDANKAWIDDTVKLLDNLQYLVTKYRDANWWAGNTYHCSRLLTLAIVAGRELQTSEYGNDIPRERYLELETYYLKHCLKDRGENLNDNDKQIIIDIIKNQFEPLDLKSLSGVYKLCVEGPMNLDQKFKNVTKESANNIVEECQSYIDNMDKKVYKMFKPIVDHQLKYLNKYSI